MLRGIMWNALMAVSCLLAFPGASAQAQQTDNHGIHAVPAPGKVAIDGKLDDWDLSGQALVCYDLESLRDVYSAQVAMMHDADSLYVALHWKDATPMGNSHDPRYQASKGWAGDCVQLRIKTDRISHVDCWYSAPGQEPFIGIAYGKSLTEPFKGGEKKLFRTEGWKLNEGAEMAFLKDPDGKGYVQEIKLPWPLNSFCCGSPFSDEARQVATGGRDIGRVFRAHPCGFSPGCGQTLSGLCWSACLSSRRRALPAGVRGQDD